MTDKTRGKVVQIDQGGIISGHSTRKHKAALISSDHSMNDGHSPCKGIRVWLTGGVEGEFSLFSKVIMILACKQIVYRLSPVYFIYTYRSSY